MNHSPPETADADVIRLLHAAEPEGAVNCQALDADALVAAASRRRASSRRKRIAGLALGAALLSIVLSLPGSRSAKPVADKTPSDSAAAELRQMLAALDQEAARRQEMVAVLRESERLARRQAELESMSTTFFTASAAGESSRSAAVSLQYAVLLEREAGDLEQARIEYQRVRERFAGTKWAASANSSLERLAASSPVHPSL